MSSTVITSIEQYIAAVGAIHRKWTAEDPENIIYPWFRGHGNHSFNLIPGLYRLQDDFDEENYRHDFQMKGYPFLKHASYGMPQTQVEWYFLMQHHGLETRLLDWTESSLIALHFAVFYNISGVRINPCVWALHPYRFNKKLHQINQTFVFDKDIEGYIPPLFKGKRIPTFPIAMQARFMSTRITAQKGQFTLHGSKRIPLEQISKIADCLEKITISYKHLGSIKRELYMNGITESMIFPDLDGLSRELKEYYRPQDID